MRPTLPLTLLVACALSDYAVSTGLNRLKAEDEVSFTLPANWSEDIAHTPGPFSALAKADKSKSKSKIKGDRFCNVVLAGYEYDLCPIFDGKDARHPPGVRGLWLKEETPPTVKYTSYTISLKGPLAKNESRSDDLQCPEGTWICMTRFNHDPKLPKEQAWRVTEVVPVAGELPLAENHTRAAHPGLNGSYKLANSHNGSKHRDVMMILHGGMYVGKNHSASLLFHCNHTAEEPTSPSFGWEYNRYHVFHWSTKHACPKNLAPDPEPTPNDPVPDPTPETPPDDVPADAGGGGENSDEQGSDFIVPPGSMNGRSKVSMFGILSIILLSSFSRVSIPTLKSPTLPSFPSLKSPRHVFRTRSRRFRPHETRLRAWATEDGILDDGYERGLLADIDGGEDVGYNLGSEEDFMVNSASARSGGTSRRAPGDALFGAGATQEDVDTDEEMPLAPSPRKFSGSKGTVKTYGSAG